MTNDQSLHWLPFKKGTGRFGLKLSLEPIITWNQMLDFDSRFQDVSNIVKATNLY